MKGGAIFRLWTAAAALFFALFVASPLLFPLVETLHHGGRLDFSPWRELFASRADLEQFGVSLALGLTTVVLSVPLGVAYAFCTHRTDVPGARLLAPLAALPLVVPPIVVAMGFADLVDARGFLACAALLSISYAPFPALLTARGLAAFDGRAYEAARLARGRCAAEFCLLRAAVPEIAIGALLVFVFAVSEHGVPEFLTVKGKTWHTYAEAIFSKWTRRATGLEHASTASPIVASVPLVLLIAVALWGALRLRRRAVPSEPEPLPLRRFGRARWLGLLAPAVALGTGFAVPTVVMGAWAAGSTQHDRPAAFSILVSDLRRAVSEAGSDLLFTLSVGAGATLLLLLVALPLAQVAARRRPAVDAFSLLPLAVPGVLFGIGCVRLFNRDLFGSFYDSGSMLVCAYAARFLPFGVLTLSNAVRRVPGSLEEAGRIAGRGALARGFRIHLPLLLGAVYSSACLVFVLALRELDVAVVLPAGNPTVVRRLSNIVHFGGENVGGALALLLFGAALLPPIVWMLATGKRLRGLT